MAACVCCEGGWPWHDLLAVLSQCLHNRASEQVRPACVCLFFEGDCMICWLAVLYRTAERLPLM